MEANESAMISTNASLPGDDSEENAKQFLMTTQYIMTIIGAAANLATMFVLKRAGDAFAPGYLLLLRNQALVDFLVCVAGTALILQPPNWRSNNLQFDTAICHVWHGQFLYWIWVLSSIWNLVAVAYERYLAICQPLKHIDLTIGRVWRLIFVAYFIGASSNSAALVQVRMDNTTCVSEYAIPGAAGIWFFFFYGIWIFLIYYLIPIVLFIILYGKVLVTLFKRRDSSDFAASRVVNSATSQMTKTAIAVTVIFVLSMSWDLWYYMLGRVGLVSYIKNTLLQLVGVWLSSANSVANPFVYMVLLPAFRKSALGLCCPFLYKNEKKKTKASES